MSYRYSSIDIIVGFGMCAIVFGALFLFVATTGTCQRDDLRAAASGGAGTCGCIPRLSISMFFRSEGMGSLQKKSWLAENH